MSGLILTVTNAGRAALVNLPNTGTNAVLMASVGVSATSFAPTPATTALPGEIKRISTIAGEAVANDTIHVTVRDESSAVYTVRSFGLYLSDGTLFAVYSQSDPIMEKSAQAMLLLAIDVAFADINATQITFGDTNFINPPATTERQGVVELATEAETTTGTDAAHAVTPKALRAAVTSWLDTRFGNGAPSTFVKGLLTSASAAALRLSLGLKSAALKDEGPGNGLDADLLDGLQASAFAQLSGAAFSGTVSTTRDFNLVYNGVPSLVGLSMSGAAMAAYNSITGTASVEIFKWLGSGGATKMALTEGGALSVLGSLVWTAGNDGAGSGLDADLLDGKDSSAFAPASHSHDYLPATSLGIYASYAVNRMRSDYYGLMLGVTTSAPVVMFNGEGLGGIFAQGVGWRLYFDGVDFHIGGLSGRKVWNAANDGAGSGLDADLLDGQHGAYYADVAGRLGYTPANRAGDNFTGTVTSSGNIMTYRGLRAVGSMASGGGDINGPGVELGGDLATGTGYLYAYDRTNTAWQTLQLAGSSLVWTQGGLGTRVPIWHAGNDGSGSGLDADLLDGVHASVPSAASTVPVRDASGFLAASGFSVANNGAGAGSYWQSGALSRFWVGGDTAGFFYLGATGASLSAAAQGNNGLRIGGGTVTFAGNTVWTAGNDGAGSGLDADLLDGLQASAFAQLSGAAFSGTVSTTRDFNLVYNGVPSLVGLSMSGAAMAAYNSITGTASVEIFKWLGSGGATKMALTEGGALSVLGSLVWTAGNDGAGSGMDADLLDGLQASDFQRVTSQNMAAVNGYRVYADGTKECWTRLTIGEHAYTTWTLPVAHTDFVHPSLAMTTAGGVSDVQDNTGITAINGTPPVSITFWNADNRTITIWVRTIGR